MAKKKEIKNIKLKDIKGLNIDISLEVPKEEFDKLLESMGNSKIKPNNNKKKK